MQHPPRTAHVKRETRESRVEVALNVDGSGRGDVATGIGFLDHMLDSLARHARFDLTLRAAGDLHVDAHHTAEDVAIVLGQAIRQALGEKKGIRRFGDAWVPMDETLAHAAIDVSGRPYCACEGFERLPAGDIAGFEHEAAEEFFRAVASAARLTLHLDLQAGTNAHHMIEACFKAFARALRAAVAIDPRETGVPSTKGTLT